MGGCIMLREHLRINSNRLGLAVDPTWLLGQCPTTVTCRTLYWSNPQHNKICGDEQSMRSAGSRPCKAHLRAAVRPAVAPAGQVPSTLGAAVCSQKAKT
jgi:hypothetical protein